MLDSRWGEWLLLAEACDLLSELALEVCSLVLVDDLLASEAVEHPAELGQSCASFSSIGQRTEATHSVTSRLGVVAVVQTPRVGLTGSLDG